MQKVAPGDVADLPEPVIAKRITVTRRDEKEECLFKLCSKLIHPTALTLTNPALTTFNIEYRKYLSIKVLRHGWGILTMLHDIGVGALKLLHASNRRTNHWPLPLPAAITFPNFNELPALREAAPKWSCSCLLPRIERVLVSPTSTKCIPLKLFLPLQSY